MRTLWLRIKCSIEDWISRRLFGLNSVTALLYMNVGKLYSDGIKKEPVVCNSCGSKWYPRVLGYSPENRSAVFCPYCGYRR